MGPLLINAVRSTGHEPGEALRDNEMSLGFGRVTDICEIASWLSDNDIKFKMTQRSLPTTPREMGDGKFDYYGPDGKRDEDEIIYTMPMIIVQIDSKEDLVALKLRWGGNQ